MADRYLGVELERLPFLKFSRIDGEREGMGSGLWLAICRGIVGAHGGCIRAESQGLGEGTRFTFALPLAEGSVTGTTCRPDRSRQQTGGQGSILVVDDPMTLRNLRDTLSVAGYTPLTTADPDQALRLFETERPTLVLPDLVMPGSDGIELTGNMLHIAQVPVTFLSGYNRDEMVARSIDARAVD